MRVLITRPHDDAEETAERLRARGHAPLICPLLTVRLRAGGEISLDGVTGLLITSANGIRALAERTPRRDLPVYAVGGQSAEAARRLGFASVRHAGGDAAALATLVAREIAPGEGKLLHAAGADTRGGLAETLLAKGYAIVSQVLYDATAATSLPASARAALRQGHADAALFFSPRTAAIFRTLIAGENLAACCRPLVAACISAATADALQALPFREVKVAPNPSQEALLDLLA